MRQQLKKLFVELFNNRKDNALLKASDVDFLESLSNEDRDSFLNRIYEAQQISIVEGFNEKEDIILPNLGTFKLKKTRDKAVKLIKKELAKKDKVYLRDVSEAERDDIHAKVSKKISEDIMESKSVRPALKSGVFKIGRKKLK